MSITFPLSQPCLTLPKAPGIYAIVNTANHHTYVGSAKNLRNRRSHHFGDLKRGKHKNAHLQSAYNLYGPSTFIFVVLENVAEEQQLVAREQHYMDLLKPEYNLAPQAGRMVGIKRSPEFLANLTAAAARANKGQKKSLEYRTRLSPLMKAARQAKLLEDPNAYKPTPEAIAKRLATHRAQVEAGEYVAPNKGRRRSPNSIAKQQATVRAKVEAGEYTTWNRGKKATPEHRANIGAAGKGRKQSPETIARRLATRKAKREADNTYGNRRTPKSPEECAKISASKKGEKKSPETIAKRTATRKANREAKLALNPDAYKQTPEQIAKRVATRKANQAAKQAAKEQSLPTLWELNE